MIRIISLILLVLVGSLIFLSDDLNFFPEEDTPSLGRVLSFEGLTLIKNPSQSEFVQITKDSKISDSTEIVTGFDSQAHLDVVEKFKLHENTAIRFAKVAHRVIVNLKRGKISRENPNGPLAFEVNGRPRKGALLEAGQGENILNVDAEGSKDSKSTLATSPIDPQFQNQIRETMKLHRRFLEKCIIKLYERQEGNIPDGLVLVRFTINKQGRSTKVTIKESDFENTDFKTCIKEVISRVQFKGYKAEPRTVDFPLQIKLPR